MKTLFCVPYIKNQAKNGSNLKILQNSTILWLSDGENNDKEHDEGYFKFNELSILSDDLKGEMEKEEGVPSVHGESSDKEHDDWWLMKISFFFIHDLNS